MTGLDQGPLIATMDVTDEGTDFLLHTERITISGERYLIYYTFTLCDDEEDVPYPERSENVSS